MADLPDFGGDDKLVVRFYHGQKHNRGKSDKAGRPIYDDLEMCEISAPADKQRKFVTPAHATWKMVPGEWGPQKLTYAMRFADQYKRFKADAAQIQSGTPLSELPFLTEAKRSELRALKIYTAEQLASLDGEPLKMLGMGGRELKNQAHAYIEAASGSADVAAMAAENAMLREQVRQMAGQSAQVAPAPEPEPEDEGEGLSSGLEAMDAAALKAFIKDKTGATPRGNPSHATLVAMAREAGQMAQAA